MRGLILGMMVLVPSMAAGQEAGRTAGEQYEALAAQFKAAMQAWEKQFNLAGDRNAPEAAKEARYRDWPGWAFAPRFVELAEFHPRDEKAVDALYQVVVDIARSVGERDILLVPHYERAVALLIRDHLDDDRLKEIFRRVARGHSPATETLLRTAMEKSRDRDVRGVACVCLAEYLLLKAEIAEKPWFEDKEKMKDPFSAFIVSRSDPGYFRYVRESSPRQAYAESWRLFERASKDYGDVIFWQDPNDPGQRRITGEIARRLLKEFSAKVGVPAPEIEGEDLDGKPMKLSDYRGQAVVLSFWGSWCPPCMAMVPHERALADRLKGKPFVLLGINADEDRRQAAKVVQAEKITWRSWADGKPPGVIATRWAVSSWPMFYIIDARGVIRYQFGGFGDKIGFDAEFDRVIAEVLGEAEGAKPPSR
jgi:thiol-disulfide isomerase/thioredoxin